MTKILKPLLASAFLIAAFASAHAQYPDHPIRVISPYPAGSASDTVTRVVLDEVSRLIGQPMVIELKPGAGGATGFATVARSDPDGYTLVTSSSSMATETVLHSKLPYDPVKDFVPVVLLGTSPNILVASAKSGFKTVDDLVKAAKEKPGTITFASAGIGSSSHMAAERFRLAAKIDVRHVPFKEGGLVQVMNGNIDFYFIPLAAASSALHSDKLAILAVSSPKRVAVIPNTPTVVCAVRVFEFQALHVRWDGTAYGSVAWATLVTHSTLLLLQTVETLVFTALLFSPSLEQRDLSAAVDNALYWYFMTLVWLPLAAIVFLSPYLGSLMAVHP